MKFTVRKEDVAAGLRRAGNVIPSRTGISFLRNVWIEAKNNSASFMAGNGGLEFSFSCPAYVEEGGLAGAQGKAFVNLIGQLENDEILVGSRGQKLVVRQNETRYGFALADNDYFQRPAAWPEENSILCEGGDFAECFDRVAFCVDPGEGEAMSCLCLNAGSSGKVEMRGLNGHQFASASFLEDDLYDRLEDDPLLVNRRYAPHLRSWLGRGGFEMNFTKKRLFLKAGSEILSMPRDDWEYPDCGAFLAKLEEPCAASISVSREAILASLNRLRVFNDASGLCAGIGLSEGGITIAAQNDLGSGHEKIAAECSGSVENIVFPVKKLAEIFSRFKSGTIEIRLSSADGPAGISGSEDPDYLVVTMPVNVSGNNYENGEEE